MYIKKSDIKMSELSKREKNHPVRIMQMPHLTKSYKTFL